MPTNTDNCFRAEAKPPKRIKRAGSLIFTGDKLPLMEIFYTLPLNGYVGAPKNRLRKFSKFEGEKGQKVRLFERIRS